MNKASNGSSVTLEGISKKFGDVIALHPVDLTVRAGEFVSVLGPSESVKTTVLRLIAGFERSASGRVLLGDQDVTTVAPFERNVNTVFQDYALFPHMSMQHSLSTG